MLLVTEIRVLVLVLNTSAACLEISQMFAFSAAFVMQQGKRKELELFNQPWITRECFADCLLKNELSATVLLL